MLNEEHRILAASVAEKVRAEIIRLLIDVYHPSVSARIADDTAHYAEERVLAEEPLTKELK